jgi:hypothetical protein
VATLCENGRRLGLTTKQNREVVFEEGLWEPICNNLKRERLWMLIFKNSTSPSCINTGC